MPKLTKNKWQWYQQFHPEFDPEAAVNRKEKEIKDRDAKKVLKGLTVRPPLPPDEAKKKHDEDVQTINTLVIELDKIDVGLRRPVAVHMTLFRNVWQYKFHHRHDLETIFEHLFGHGTSGLHVTLDVFEDAEGQNPHCFIGGPNQGRTPRERDALQGLLDGFVKKFKEKITEIKRDFDEFEFVPLPNPLDHLLVDPKDCFEEIAHLTTLKHKVDVEYPAQTDQALLWSGGAIHPMQALQNTHQMVVRDACRGLDGDAAKDRESLELSTYFYFRAGTPKLMGPADSLPPDIEDQLQKAESDLTKLEYPGELKLYELPVYLRSILATLLNLRSLFNAGDVPIPALINFDTRVKDINPEIDKVLLGSPPSFEAQKVSARLKRAHKEITAALNGLCAVQNFHIIEPFYLFRLMAKFRIESDKAIPSKVRSDVSSMATGLLHNSPHQRWLFRWLRNKLVELDKALKQACPEKGPPTDDWPGGEPVVAFFLKGGRAAKYLQDRAEGGENDWDTNIVINPTLRAADWYHNFRRVHDTVLVFLQQAKIEFYVEAYRNGDSFSQALLAKYPEFETDDLVRDRDLAIRHQAEAAEAFAKDKGEIQKKEAEGCKAELIDIGIPRRDTVEAFEQWYNVCPKLIVKADGMPDGMPIPGHLYYIAEYVTMIREAFMDKSISLGKTPKRVVRLLEVLNMGNELQQRVDEELHHIPEDTVASSKKAIKAYSEPIQRMLAILLKQFVEAFDLAEDAGLAEQFDVAFARDLGNMKTKAHYPTKLKNVIAAEKEKEKFEDAAGPYGVTPQDLADAIGYAQWISQAIDEHLREERSKFILKNRTIFTNFVKAIYTASFFSKNDDLEVQFAVTGAFAARLHAENARFEKERFDELEPLRRLDLKIYCQKGSDPAVVRDLLSDLIQKYIRHDSTPMFRYTPRGNDSICLTWPEPLVFKSFTYKPMMIKLTVESRDGDWPQLSFIQGLPVLSLRDLVWESKKHAGRVEETFTQRGLRTAIEAMVDILTRLENPKAGKTWGYGHASPPALKHFAPASWKAPGTGEWPGGSSAGSGSGGFGGSGVLPGAPRRAAAGCGHCPGGVANTGTSCFVNVGLQAISVCNFDLPATPGTLRDVLIRITAGDTVWHGDARNLRRDAMALARGAAWVDRGHQEDAAQFLEETLDNGGQARFQIQDTITQLHHAPRTATEDLQILPLSMVPPGANLETFLERYRVDTDDSGQRHVRAFTAAPRVLPIQLRRFQLVHVGGSPPHGGLVEQKISARVDVPLQLDLHRWQGPRYNLIAFAVHLGDQIDGGHFVAYVKRGTRWHFVDDSHDVTCGVSITSALRNAYLLFYERAG